jgi:hypothetical protein
MRFPKEIQAIDGLLLRALELIKDRPPQLFDPLEFIRARDCYLSAEKEARTPRDSGFPVFTFRREVHPP